MKNILPIDRFLRLLLSVVLLEAGFFWLSGVPQLLAYLAGAVMLVTGAISFCPIYKVIGVGPSAASCSRMPALWVRVVAVLVLLGAVMAGSYASAVFSRKFFLEDFNAMNHHYKQTLFFTGKADREKAVSNYDLWVPAFEKFENKYSVYRPFAVRSDSQFSNDLGQVKAMMLAVKDAVKTGDLHQAHLDLEKVRPVFQEQFKRNGFSMLSVALVDFHDAMELMLDSGNAKDVTKTLALYAQVNAKLQAIEAEANDTEIQAIRVQLDALYALAKEGKADALPVQAEKLKTSFVKVYLKRG
ncbi:MAG: hypothetical protein RLZZ433_938 [Pseudomonadota bacterium]|jgi:hypothetical protein